MTIKPWGILGIQIGYANRLGNDGKTTFRNPKEHANMIIVGEPRRTAIGLEMHQMNVKMTFLNDEFDMKIYIE